MYTSTGRAVSSGAIIGLQQRRVDPGLCCAADAGVAPHRRPHERIILYLGSVSSVGCDAFTRCLTVPHSSCRWAQQPPRGAHEPRVGHAGAPRPPPWVRLQLMAYGPPGALRGASSELSALWAT